MQLGTETSLFLVRKIKVINKADQNLDSMVYQDENQWSVIVSKARRKPKARNLIDELYTQICHINKS
jgi:hypothetical protein